MSGEFSERKRPIPALSSSPTGIGKHLEDPEFVKAADKARINREVAEGEIKRKWGDLGGAPGQPTVPGDVGLIAIGDGFYREYSNNARIYYRNHKSVFVYGDIGNKYTQLNGPGSWLGWPTADEQPFTEDGRVTTFEHGAIYWWSDTGAIDLGDIAVRYSGLYCFGETDNDQLSGADDPYVIFGVIPPPPAVPSAPRTTIYEGVDAGDSREDNIELYRGLPHGLSVVLTLMEHDIGDPEKKRKAVEDGVNAAAHAVASASAAIPVIGPAVAVALELVWQGVGDDVTKAVNDTLNFEDDQIDVKPVYITGKQMVTLARAGRQNLKGIEWQLDSPLLSGDGASYKAYFVVEAM